MRDTTLCLLVKEKEIVLAMKKRGFGKGRYNGYGGKPNWGESIEAAAIRELKEESGIDITAKDLKKHAEIEFHFPQKPEWSQRVHVFRIDSWQGTPQESDEMAPEVFSVDNIPFEQMWPDDKHWFSHFLAKKFIKASFTFSADQTTIEKMDVKTFKENIFSTKVL